jgi:hypothetical protein
MVDGLNGNVDIFVMQDFSYADTLDIGEGIMLAALQYSDRLYIGTKSAGIFVFQMQRS